MTERPSFELKRFAWAAPDRLDLSGVFSGVAHELAGEPSLVVRGSGGEHRLPAIADSIAGSLEDDWAATFAWQEVPEAFDEAQLEFAGGLSVVLPQPGKRALRRQVLEVHGINGHATAEPEVEASAAQEAAPEEMAPETPAPETPAPETPAPEPPPAAADSLRVQAELLATEERLRQSQTAVQQAQAELERARADLAAEREGRRADGERFQQVLQTFRAAAEEAVSAEQGAAAQLGTDLREAQEALDAATASRAEAEAQLAPLRERVAELEQSAVRIDAMRDEREEAREQASAAVAEAAELRAALEEAEGKAKAAHAELAAVRSALDGARADAQRLLGHLTPDTEPAADA
jgi:hypothetical protein